MRCKAGCVPKKTERILSKVFVVLFLFSGSPLGGWVGRTVSFSVRFLAEGDVVGVGAKPATIKSRSVATTMLEPAGFEQSQGCSGASPGALRLRPQPRKIAPTEGSSPPKCSPRRNAGSLCPTEEAARAAGGDGWR